MAEAARFSVSMRKITRSWPPCRRWRSPLMAASLRCREPSLGTSIAIAKDRLRLFRDAEDVPFPGAPANRYESGDPGYICRQREAEHDRREPQEGLGGDQ